MKIKILLLFLAALFTTSFANAEVRRHVLQSQRSDGRIEVRIYDEDASLAQARISQQLVTRRITDSAGLPRAISELAQVPQRTLPELGSPLWVAKQNFWTNADENDYSNWFANNVDESFAAGSGISADCADMGLLFRWVYARDHQLPIANTLANSGKLFGHFSSNADWDKLPTNTDWKKDERFKAALQYLWDNTYTHTIAGDIAPTFVQATYIRPGSMFMIIRQDEGHTQTIRRVDKSTGIYTLWGNVPASESIGSSSLITEIPAQEFFGIWRTPILQTLDGKPQWTLVPTEKTPGYSNEQAGMTFTDDEHFMIWVNDRLGINVSDATRMNAASNDFCDALFLRWQVVTQGLFACHYQQCPTNSQAYSDFSTFDRDARIVKMQAVLQKLIAKVGETSSQVVNLYQLMSEEKIMSVGPQLSYLDLFKNENLAAVLNPDPSVSFAERWGIHLQNPEVSDNFYIDAQVMLNLLEMRVWLIDDAEGSSDLDQNMRQIFNQALLDRQNPKFDPSVFTQVHASFDAQSSDPLNLNDVTWHDGSFNQVKLWSSKASDGFDLRWGIGATP